MEIIANTDTARVGRLSAVDTHIGKLLLDAGKLNQNDIKNIIALQKEEGLRFGEAALRLGLATEQDVLRALSVQFEYPCVPPGEAGFSKEVIAAYEPFSKPVEALRALRSQLMLRWFGGRRKMLSVTSVRAGEGASALAANLAVTFAQLGEKTLLIDADLRNPGQYDLFGLKPAAGLSNLLAGRGTLYDAVEFIEQMKGLSVLCAGATPPNPQELLSRATFRELLAAAAEDYDVIIIDTPPALASADAQIISAITGGSLLVARRNETRVDDVSRLKEQFLPAGAVLLGVVLNG